MSWPEVIAPELSLPRQTAVDCPHHARVLRQLLEAVLFEQIVPYRFDGRYFSFHIAEQAYRARGRLSGFGRVRLVADDICQLHNGVAQRVNLAALVQALPGSPDATQRLLQELQQTITFCRWNQHNLRRSRSRRSLDYIALESTIDEGHPYHPCFKARSGFSLADHARYGPEAGQPFQLCWLAVRRPFLAMQLDCPSETAFWQRELGSATWQQLCDAMQAEGAALTDYALLPVHPWQLNALQQAIEQPVALRQLIVLGRAGDYYQAGISLRTLFNVSHKDKANIKLPLNVVNSSSLRTIEPHSVCTAPRLSRWLQSIIEQDPWFEQNTALDIQSEYAGLVLNDAAAPPNQHWLVKLAPALSVIFRDSRPLYASGYRATPFVALTLTEADGAAFIAPWLQRYGIQCWLDRLIEVVVIPVWHLLVRHGIALETHAQNMTLLHDNGWPQQLVLRDFHESLEFVSTFLDEPGLQPDFTALHPDYRLGADDRYYWMSSIEALRELLVDTLFVYNLAELAFLLEQQFAYPEALFWLRIDEALSRYAATAKGWSARLAQLDLHQAQIQTESLLRKKLSGQPGSEFHHRIPNPLHQSRHGASDVIY
ncbi:MAG: IucA/IucC family protein [Gammaproteobacteria bacterium]|nr:IucA/IucC family protein [Gammaproteobacteria bacterium]MBU2185267.1 IucA/IucC family protein [Gammaproteobacteria bacterium]MBU2205058.1 IucA/IucC family protein [Gammaproteobacteria bacterium]